MSELSILELETEHAEVLPERDTLLVLGAINGGHNHVIVAQSANALAGGGFFNTAAAVNVAVVNVG